MKPKANKTDEAFDEKHLCQTLSSLEQAEQIEQDEQEQFITTAAKGDFISVSFFNLGLQYKIYWSSNWQLVKQY